MLADRRAQPEQADWGKDLNNDPRLRGIAGLGLWMGILEQEDLIEAASLGHDIGHPPFGHDGERFLSKLTQANSNYLDAEGNYINAVMEVLNARLQLDKLMNQL